MNTRTRLADNPFTTPRVHRRARNLREGIRTYEEYDGTDGVRTNGELLDCLDQAAVSFGEILDLLKLEDDTDPVAYIASMLKVVEAVASEGPEDLSLNTSNCAVTLSNHRCVKPPPPVPTVPGIYRLADGGVVHVVESRSGPGLEAQRLHKVVEPWRALDVFEYALSEGGNIVPLVLF